MLQKKCTVSVLARILGVSPDSVRHYERIGLLPRAERSQSGYRVWNGQKIEYLRWVAPAKRAGFSLRELAEIFHMYRSGMPPCRTVRDTLKRKLIDLDGQIVELNRMRRQLRKTLSRWNVRLLSASPSEFV